MRQLQAVNQQQAEKVAYANITVDVCMEKIAALWQASASIGSAQSSHATPLGVQLPTHQEMGGHVRLPTASGPIPSSMATPNSLSVPLALTPIGGLPPRMTDIGTPMLPRLMPQRSVSLASPPLPEQEENMDSEPQEEPESRE